MNTQMGIQRMGEKDLRDRTWSELDQNWDLIVVGGGITGAGILREATRAGLKTLLLEASDFASGTSSRSSKLVHGGLRYLKNAQIRLTLESVREREYLLKQGKGLVQPLSFLLANYRRDKVPGYVYGIGLSIYDLMGLQWGHRRYDPGGILALCPQLSPQDLQGGYRFFDAVTDDARLVLRVIQEAVQNGGTALNYARVIDLLLDRDGFVKGVLVEDQSTEGDGHLCEVQAPAVINATGAWADQLRQSVGGRSRLRQLRGSHLVFPWERVPLNRAVSFLHPFDSRPVFAYPWEGVTLFGTTDVDHPVELETDPAISSLELDYLLSGLEKAFPALSLAEPDVQATWAGIRAVLDTGSFNPSKESREAVLWRERGLLTATGGKLTTFRITAHDALRKVRRRIRDRLPGQMILHRRLRVLDDIEISQALTDRIDPLTAQRLVGRYGSQAYRILNGPSADLEIIEFTPYLWGEIRLAARQEQIVHLEDLLLRRVRLGLLLPQGGLEQMPRIATIVKSELGWNELRWEQELQDYQTLLQSHYSVPHTGLRTS
jgi:glycerol-3-phosphate dehydrogenase